MWSLLTGGLSTQVVPKAGLTVHVYQLCTCTVHSALLEVAQDEVKWIVLYQTMQNKYYLQFLLVNYWIGQTIFCVPNIFTCTCSLCRDLTAVLLVTC